MYFRKDIILRLWSLTDPGEALCYKPEDRGFET
jgi:hypothetical protein